jgi:regulatory protein
MKPRRSALAYALALLGRRDYSTFEIEQKLEGKGYLPEEICLAVRRLREWNYLDDEKYVRRQIEKYRMGKKSRTYIRQRLKSAGLEPTLVAESLDHWYSLAQEREVIRSWWEKCFTDQTVAPEKKTVMKWARRLYAAGFPGEELRSYLNNDQES